ncbi:hypothetical protein [Staphylococcus hominis]|uniref:hypothetical protein n=1 Tax=Staphylococcus hominis TaxID=1290 RepID=UPI002006483F|nr:hypothetical protein [Staphylococcus hominis]MCK6224444.1 hypothetical protein [Staphylococcus hominis]
MKFKEYKDEKRGKIIGWVVGIIIAALVILLVIIGFHNSNDDDVFVGLCTLYTGILAITGVCFTIYFNQKIKDKELYEAQKLKNQELLNELDQKSEWRKELMNIAAKPVIQLEDVYRILASLRFLPKSEDEIKESNQPKFDEISNYIYKHLNEMLNDTLKKVETKNTLNEKGIKIQMSIKESEEIRLYTKFLLKHHWEYNKGEEDKEKFKKKELNEFRKVIKEIKRLNENPIISNVYYKTKVHIGELEEN